MSIETRNRGNAVADKGKAMRILHFTLYTLHFHSSGEIVLVESDHGGMKFIVR